jgi:hypothetical protein
VTQLLRTASEPIAAENTVVDFPRAERRLVQVGRDLKLYLASQGKPLFHSPDK